MNRSDILQQFNISKIQKSSFGVAKPTFNELEFAAGYHKFSQLCGFRFISSVNQKNPNFRIVYVAKYRGNVFHKTREEITGKNWYPDLGVRSMWYIMQMIDMNTYRVINPETLLNEYNFDINLFFKSQYFKQSVKSFKQYVASGLSQSEDLKSNIQNGKQKNLVGKYQNIISASLKMIDNLQIWERSEYTLQNFQAGLKI